MFKRCLHTLLAAALLVTATGSFGYDSELATSYARLFAPAIGAKTGKALHLMKVQAFVDGIKQGKEFVTLDVRTPAESGIFMATLPGSLAIPVDRLFQPENLDRLPTDKRIVVLCQSGTRAAAVGTALRHVGFDNVYILKGGFKALAGYLNAKTSNGPAEKIARR